MKGKCQNNGNTASKVIPRESEGMHEKERNRSLRPEPSNVIYMQQHHLYLEVGYCQVIKEAIVAEQPRVGDYFSR